MKTKLTLIILFINLLCLFTFDAKAQWQWVDKAGVGSLGDSRTTALVTTKNGDTYAIGEYNDDITVFQNFVLKSAGYGTRSPYVIKYNTNGTVKWASGIITSGVGYGTAIAIDEKENVYVTGSFTGKAYFDNNFCLYNAGNSAAMFMAKYDKDGNFLWAQKQDNVYPYGIAVDKFGKIDVTGTYLGQLQIQNTFLLSQGSSDILVAQYDNDGKFSWAQGAGTKAEDYALAIATDNLGNIFITGNISNGMANFSGLSYDNSKANKAATFLAKYDLKGNPKWIRTAISSEPTSKSRGAGVACDEFGDCYITGSFNFNINFGQNIVLAGDADDDIFTAKYSTAGKVIWANYAGGHTNLGDIQLLDDEGLGIAIDKSGSGNVLITGYFESNAKFGNQSLICQGEQDIFVAKYGYNGDFKSVVTAFGYSIQKSACISTDAYNNFYIGGRFADDAYFGWSLYVVGNPGLYNAYIGKYHTSNEQNLPLINSGETSSSISASSRISIYPNPAQSELNIETFVSQKGALGIQIVDPSGRVVYSENKEVASGMYQEKIQIRDYPVGVYYLNITDASSKQTIKFVKE